MKRSRGVIILILALTLWAWATPVAAQSGRTTVIAQDFDLAGGETLSHDLVVIGGQVHLERDSVVLGDVTIMGGEVTLQGRVEGDVVVFGGGVELTESAVIQGDVVVFGGIRRHPQSEVTGNVVSGLAAGQRLGQLSQSLRSQPDIPGRFTPARPTIANAMNRTANSLPLLAILLVAVLGIVLLPDHIERIAGTMQVMPAVSFGVGLLTIVASAVLIPILFIICIGIPIALGLGLALILCALMGWVATGRLVGAGLSRTLRLAHPTPLLETVLGVTAISIVAMLPCIGWLIALLLGSWGIGAVVLTRFGTTAYATRTPFTVPPIQDDPSASPFADDETRRLDEPFEG